MQKNEFKPAPDLLPEPIEEIMTRYQKWKESFNQPMDLQARKAISVVCCMDSRLMPASMFGFELGDAEYIRNAGGRVTEDVLRSLFVAQEVLHTKIIFLIHHTDCGGQHASVEHDHLVQRAKEMGFDLENVDMKPIPPTDEGLEQSVRDDVKALVESPMINKKVNIYGFVYNVYDGSLKEIVREERHGYEARN